MKLNIKFLIPALFIVFNQLIQCESQNLEASSQTNQTQTEQNTEATQSKDNQIPEDKLASFSYGSEEFKLAIIGDSGAERESREVMKLTSYDAVLHLGDYDYECKPDKYFDTILDSDRSYQFMGILGNHEGKSECQEKFNDYRDLLYKEMTNSKNSDVKCEFSSTKVMWVCIYKNMRIIGLTPGINGTDSREEQLAFLKKHLEGATEDWKICSWHYYDKYYHTGKYHEDSERNVISGSGESFYDYCKDHGAIILSAHDHVFARTHVMSQFKSPVIDEYDKDTDGRHLQIRKGATLNILNGVGGYEMYIEEGPEKDYDHWQKKYARGAGAENAKKYGGLFCKFNFGGNNKKAYCELLRINSSEKLFDSFYIYQNEDPGTVTYDQMDEAFLNEKRSAYLKANNLGLIGSETDGSNGDANNIIDKVFNRRNIIIGSTICAAAILLGGGMFITRRPKKQANQLITEPKLISRVSYGNIDDSSYGIGMTSLQAGNSFFTTTSMSNSKFNNNDPNHGNTTMNRSDSISSNNNNINNNSIAYNRSIQYDNFSPLPTPDILSPLTMTMDRSTTFSPLPMPDGLSFLGSKGNSKNEYSFFDNSFLNRDDYSIASNNSSNKKPETIGRSSTNSDALSLINNRFGKNGRSSSFSTTKSNNSVSLNVKYNHVNNNNIRFNSFARPNNNNNNNNN